MTDDSKPPSGDAFREWLQRWLQTAKAERQKALDDRNASGELYAAGKIVTAGLTLEEYDRHAAERERERQALEVFGEAAIASNTEMRLCSQTCPWGLDSEYCGAFCGRLVRIGRDKGILPPEGER